MRVVIVEDAGIIFGEWKVDWESMTCLPMNYRVVRFMNWTDMNTTMRWFYVIALVWIATGIGLRWSEFLMVPLVVSLLPIWLPVAILGLTLGGLMVSGFIQSRRS